MHITITTPPEPRTRHLGHPGLYAEVDAEVDGRTITIQVSRLDGETEWTVDAMFRGSFPIFCNGYGARYLRTKVVTPEVAAALDAAMVSA